MKELKKKKKNGKTVMMFGYQIHLLLIKKTEPDQSLKR